MYPPRPARPGRSPRPPDLVANRTSGGRILTLETRPDLPVPAPIIAASRMLLPFLLAAGIDGNAALQHAARLSSVGPHPWGSGLGRGAAQYVAAQLRQAGLDDV